MCVQWAIDSTQCPSNHWESTWRILGRHESVLCTTLYKCTVFFAQFPNMKSESCGGSDCTHSIMTVTSGATLIYLLLGAGNTSLIWNPKHSKNKDIQNTSSSLGPNSYLFVRNRVFVFQCQVCVPGIGWLGPSSGLGSGTQAPRRTHHGNCCPV